MRYSCDPGLVPEGRMRATCTRNGWSPNPADLNCSEGIFLWVVLVLIATQLCTTITTLVKVIHMMSFTDEHNLSIILFLSKYTYKAFSEIFTFKIFHITNFCRVLIFVVSFESHNLLMIDGYNMDETV